MKATHWLLAAALAGLSTTAIGQEHPSDSPVLKPAPASQLLGNDTVSTRSVALPASETPGADMDGLVFSVREGWLSDALRNIAKTAGFDTLVWTPDPAGRLDFRIAESFQFRAATAMDALELLVGPYPLRLCVFTTDQVVQAKPVNQPCL